MRKLFTPIVCGGLLSTLLLPSCATMIATSSQRVRLVGQPAGSVVYVNDQEVTPKPVKGAPGAVCILVPRKKTTEVKIKREGYKDYHDVLYPAKINKQYWLNYALGAGIIASTPLFSTTETGGSAAKPWTSQRTNFAPIAIGAGVMLFAPLVDIGTGAGFELNKDEIRPVMVARPTPPAGGQTLQCTQVNVRVKGGDKLGSTYTARKEVSETLYFGKSLDANAANLMTNVNSELKELGYNVPAEGKSVFATSPSARYTLQGEMRDIHYDIHASPPSAGSIHYETICAVEVTWKLVNQSRQTVFEQKTSGSSIKFENGGTAAFEDAFENSLYTFLNLKEVPALLDKAAGPTPAVTITGANTPDPGTPAAGNLAPITVHRAAPLKLTGDNGIGAASRCVVTIETADGHGSGCLISADGYLITNAHVVGEEATVKVHLADGLEVKGKVVRVNTEMDLALVKIDVDGLTGFQLPTAASAELGADVFAIGTPADKELGQSITKGIISGRRKIEGHAFLQTDVSINGGNSGGAR
jgi:S1-C subfamily serine protease